MTANTDDIYNMLRGVAVELNELNSAAQQRAEAAVWGQTYAACIAMNSDQPFKAKVLASEAVRLWRESRDQGFPAGG